jgi:DNA polymerase-3 subunit delta'
LGGQIKIDQIRQVIHFMQQTAKQGGYRVVVIEPVEMMNEAAQNALLKTLEEPGQGAQFILVSHHPQAILPTISSRCQRLPFSLPTEAGVLAWLQRLPVGRLPADTTPEQAIESLSAVSGSPLALLTFLQDAWCGERLKLKQALQALLAGEQTFSQVAQAWQSWPLVERIALVIQMFEQRVKSLFLQTSDDRTVQNSPQGMLLVFETYRQLLGYYQMARSANSLNEVLLWEKVLYLWQSS